MTDTYLFSRKVKWLISAVALCFVLMICTPVVNAQDQTELPPVASELTEAERAAAEAAVAEEAAEVAAEDLKIEARLATIFNQNEGFKDIQVDVMAGIVTLSGSVPNDVIARNALELAGGVDGVLTVNDEINRTLALSENLSPMLATFKSTIAGFIRALPLICIALVTFLIFMFLGNRLANWSRLWQRIAPNPFLAEIIGQAVRIVTIVLGVVLALKMVGADELMATILGGAGVIGLAIGFAVRDTIENYISSIMLSIRQPFRANDHVKINNHEGKVVRLTSRATILMTLDGNHLRIPNATVFKAVILNFSRNPDRRFKFELGVDADDDPIEAMDTALAAISKLDFLLDDPKPSASIKEVGSSNIILSFSAWVNQNTTSFGKARSHAIRTATSILVDEGFTMPEPIYRLRLDERAAQILTQGQVSGVKSGKSKSDPDSVAERKSQTPKADVAPETHLDDRVNQERVQEGEKDLLDSGRPVE